MMGGHMDLMTVAQQTGAQGLGGNRSATIKPRNHLLLDGDVSFDTVSRDYKGDQAFKAKLEKPR